MSHVIVRIPTPLRKFTEGADELTVEGETVSEVLSILGQQNQGLLEQVLTEQGETRHFVNIYLGSQDVRSLDAMHTRVAEGDVLSIVPAVAGG